MVFEEGDTGMRHQYTCPDCGSVGASDYVPLCHVCDYNVLMKPSSNGRLLSKNERMYKYYESLGHEIPKATLSKLLKPR